MTSESKLQDWILETIDQLRKRKARPDLERICHMIERRHGIGALQTQAKIESLVISEVVIKVDYKGNTSYRNAAKWGKNNISGQIQNSKDVSRLLLDAVRVLSDEATLEHTASLGTGVSLGDVEKYLSSQNSLSLFTKNKLQVALEREVVAVRMLKLASGNYTLNEIKVPSLAKEVQKSSSPLPEPSVPQIPLSAPLAPPPPPPPPSSCVKPAGTTKVVLQLPVGCRVETSMENVSVPSPTKKGRPPNKRKRFKKTHGPDFVENYDSSFEEPEPKCDYCLLTAACNYHGKQEDLLFCKDCNAKAHPSCMDYSAELAMRSRMSPWQCMDCKTCYVCDDSGDADSMLFCDACDKGYHMSCHSPKVTEKPLGKWVCRQCGDEIKKESRNQTSVESMETVVGQRAVNTIDGAPGLPTPCESPVPEAEQNKHTFNFFLNNGLSDREAEDVPDASEWTIDDVEKYFRQVGFPDQAVKFKEQEIDGKSLLLLKRSDVLTGLAIKLGPALKIYNHVKVLQTRRLDGQPIC